MRERPTARVFVLDPEQRVLLFRFVFKDGPLSGTIFWATPGGALEQGESFEDGAKRELREETGITVQEIGPPVTERRFELRLPDGTFANAHEKIFLVRVSETTLTNAHQTEEERQFLQGHKWWSLEELEAATEKIYPEDIVTVLKPYTTN